MARTDRARRTKNPDEATLEDFSLKGNHLAKMTGISTAIHAIPDGFLLMHTGVGCKYKAAAQVANQDWGSHPNRREAWTQVAELQLIKGCSVRIGPFARSWYERRRPNFMCVVSAYFIELTGEDFSYSVDKTEETLPCDMALINTAAPNGGFWDGYASVMLEVLKNQDFRKTKPEPGNQAAAVGFFFSRYEPDQQADVAQVRQLAKVAGLDVGPVLLSGRPYTELSQAVDCPVILQLPYIHPKRRKLRRLFRKREVIELDLPIGINATRRFVRTIAEARGTDLARVDAWLDQAEGAVRAQLDKLSDHVRDAHIALFAEPPLAAGLVALMADMGITTSIVGLRDTHGALGGKIAFLEALERNGITDVSKMEIVEEPSLRWIREHVVRAISENRINGVIGSSHELRIFQYATRRMAITQRTFLLEAGFPSDAYHATYAMPTMGFTGAAIWTQRVLEAIRSPKVGAERAFG